MDIYIYIHIYIHNGWPWQGGFSLPIGLLIAVMQTITPTDLPGHEDAKGYSHEKVSIHCAIIWKNQKKKHFWETLLWGPPYPKESRNSVMFLFFLFILVLLFFLFFWFWGLGGVPIGPGGSLPSTPKVFLMSFQFYNKMVQYRVYTRI